MSQAATTGAAPDRTGLGSYARRLVADGLRLGEVPRLHLVPRPVRGAPRAPFVALVLGLLAVGLLGLLVLHTVMQQRSFALHDLERSNELLAERVQELRDDIDAREAPAGLAAEAQALGMVPTASSAFLDLADGDIQGRLEPSQVRTSVPLTDEAEPLGTGAMQPVQPAPQPKPEKPAKPTKSAATKDESAQAATGETAAEETADEESRGESGTAATPAADAESRP